MATELKEDGFYWVRTPRGLTVCQVQGSMLEFIGWCVQHQGTDWCKKNVEWLDRITEPKAEPAPELSAEPTQPVAGDHHSVVHSLPEQNNVQPSQLLPTVSDTAVVESEMKTP